MNVYVCVKGGGGFLIKTLNYKTSDSVPYCETKLQFYKMLNSGIVQT